MKKNRVNTAPYHKRALIDVRKKLKLEPHLAKDMKTVLRRIVKHFQISYPIDHSTDVPQRYEADVTTALRNHYRRVSKAFMSYGDDIAEANKKSFECIGGLYRGFLNFKKKGKIKESADHKLTNYIASHSQKQAALIIKTTQRDMHEEIGSVIADAAKNGTPINSKRIADAVASAYLKKVNGRAKIISVTETQSMAEKTKLVDFEESMAMSGDDGDETSTNYSRIWVSLLDEKTRDWHAEADGLQADPGEPFIVMGEELDYPGDPNGSPENIINCRCTVVAAAS